MKKKIQLFVIISILCSGCVYSNKSADALNKVIHGNVLHRMEDYRLLYCSAQDVLLMSSNSQCLIIFTSRSRIIKQVRIATASNLTLKNILDPIVGIQYDGQIKVIKRNSITQTPCGDSLGSSEDLLIESGDLIFIGPRD